MIVEKTRCITFDKGAQDALPENIKAKMKADREKARNESRYEEIRNCKTPEELSCVIWTKGFEDAMQSSMDIYRKPFVKWINEYVSGKERTEWKYSTPRKLAECIWMSFKEGGREHFGKLHQTFVDWVENYKSEREKNK